MKLKKHETKVNRRYKNRLFRMIFADKAALLGLYNAINGSSYTNPEDLEITTLDDVIYMGMKNDMSFIIVEVLNLYEHQASFNPNMPVRGFLYFADLYRAYIEKYKLNLYSSHMVKLPLPQYLVFYNGLKEEADRSELRLSHVFAKQTGKESCIEVVAVMLNINLGHNKELMVRCRKLNEYARFVARVREDLERGLSLREAADEAIKIGREEGCAIGISKGLSNAVLELLGTLGEVSDSLRDRILQEEYHDILKKWLKLVSGSDTVEMFRERME